MMSSCRRFTQPEKNPDTDATFVYARFFRQVADGRLEPLTGRHYELWDRDAPPPPGDDAPRPTSDASYVPPTGDQRIAGGLTSDWTGMVRVRLAHEDMVTTAGHHQVHFPGGADFPVSIDELKPDLYFKLEGGARIGDGITVNHRDNVGTSHLGTASNPVTVVVSEPWTRHQ
jgi:hypothetical protein